MGIIEKFFPAKAAITSETIRAEIGRAQGEITALHAKLDGVMASVATLAGSEHVALESNMAATKRAIARLEARVDHLVTELPKVIAAEEAAAQVAADAALRARAEAARKANSKEAAALLRDYDKLASQIGDVLAKLGAIADERNSVNEALRTNPVMERVAGYDDLHRKSAGREATEQCERRPVWVYSDGSEEPAALDGEGRPQQPAPKWIHHEQKFAVAELAHREIVTGRTSFRPGQYVESLSAVRLPPAFADSSSFFWPRS